MQTRKVDLMLYRKSAPLFLFFTLAVSLLLLLTLTSSSYPQNTAKPKPKSPSATKQLLAAVPANTVPTSESCLGCHGPYEKLFKSSANYTFDDGSKVNPHITVEPTARNPHASGKGVLECAKCHEPHPIPLVSAKGLPRANLDYCFGCHHLGVFTVCSKCHEGRT